MKIVPNSPLTKLKKGGIIGASEVPKITLVKIGTKTEGKHPYMTKERKPVIYGYCRVSRKEQSIERQERNIEKSFPNAHLVIEQGVTGTTMERPKWQQLYKKLKRGDTVVFDSVSRMSRNAEEGFQAYQALYNKGVNLIFLKEPHINTDTYKKALSVNIDKTGDKVDFILEGIEKYLMALAEEQIRLAFEQSEKEVDDLHERVKEGLITAKLNGKQIGRAKGAKVETKKAKEAKQDIIKYSKDFKGSLPDDAVIKMLRISRNSYYKYKKELRIAESVTDDEIRRLFKDEAKKQQTNE